MNKNTKNQIQNYNKTSDFLKSFFYLIIIIFFIFIIYLLYSYFYSLYFHTYNTITNTTDKISNTISNTSGIIKSAVTNTAENVSETLVQYIQRIENLESLINNLVILEKYLFFLLIFSCILLFIILKRLHSVIFISKKKTEDMNNHMSEVTKLINESSFNGEDNKKLKYFEENLKNLTNDTFKDINKIYENINTDHDLNIVQIQQYLEVFINKLTAVTSLRTELKEKCLNSLKNSISNHENLSELFDNESSVTLLFMHYIIYVNKETSSIVNFFMKERSVYEVFLSNTTQRLEAFTSAENHFTKNFNDQIATLEYYIKLTDLRNIYSNLNIDKNLNISNKEDIINENVKFQSFCKTINALFKNQNFLTLFNSEFKNHIVVQELTKLDSNTVLVVKNS